jgi:pathogenesis-related protein 1
MRSSCLLILIGAGCSAGNPAFSTDEIRQPFVDEHNEVRRVTPNPPADPPLAPLEWSDELAQVAQRHAEGCIFEHSDNPYGENLAFFSCPGGFRDPCNPNRLGSNPGNAVKAWADEVVFYDYDTSSCAPLEQCGHYTQIVWRETTTLGCGSAVCKIDGIYGVYWVCNYDPPGNIVGERPY